MIAWILWRIFKPRHEETTPALPETRETPATEAPAVEYQPHSIELILRRELVYDAPSPTRSPGLPDRDNWETDYLLGTEGEFPVEVRAAIHYVDGAGQASRRNIRTRTVAPWGDDQAILAFCEMRLSHRTFLISRLREFVDLETGEVVQDVGRYLREAYYRSPHGQLEALVDGMEDELTILTFLARADGRLMPKERQSILAYLGRTHPDVELDEVGVRKILDTRNPTSRDYKAALRSARLLPNEQRTALLQAVEELGGARTKIDALTNAAVTVAREHLSAGGA